MKSIKISDEAHNKLVAFKAYLTLKRSKAQTMDDAVLELLEKANAENYRKVLEAKQ